MILFMLLEEGHVSQLLARDVYCCQIIQVIWNILLISEVSLALFHLVSIIPPPKQV